MSVISGQGNGAWRKECEEERKVESEREAWQGERNGEEEEAEQKEAAG